MSRKAWKRTRRDLKAHVRALDASKRLARKVPRWRTVMLALGFGGFVKRWLSRWERKHADALRRALKKTAHFAIKAGAEAVPGAHHIKDFPGVQPDKPWPRPPAKPKQDDTTLRERAGLD
jgi:hypothetical protein